MHNEDLVKGSLRVNKGGVYICKVYKTINWGV